MSRWERGGSTLTAKLPRRVLLRLHQGCAREPDKAGIGQHLFHLRPRLAIHTPVALVHQHEDVRRFALELARLDRCLELINDRRDDALLALGDELGQVFPRLRSYRLFPAGEERLPDRSEEHT